VEVIPAIDLRGGRCVRLVQGDYSRELTFSDDPVAVACRWEEEGAPRLHVVDLEGARTGAPAESSTIERIVASVSIPVQVAGGIRSLEHANHYLRAGADRIVFGTAAVKNPTLIIEALAMDAAAVVVALDHRDGSVKTDGWLAGSDADLVDLARRMQTLGVRRVLSTDISRDGMLTEPNYQSLEELTAATSLAVIASGGVSNADHVRRLAALKVEAVIIGRALYSGKLALSDALASVVES
jgi:phosphoribosylformimino-5-aminoimidazole carboxamide ribotide isomerase